MPHPHRTTAKSLWEVRPTQQINVELKTITMIKIKSCASVSLLCILILLLISSSCQKSGIKPSYVTSANNIEDECFIFTDTVDVSLNDKKNKVSFLLSSSDSVSLYGFTNAFSLSLTPLKDKGEFSSVVSIPTANNQFNENVYITDNLPQVFIEILSMPEEYESEEFVVSFKAEITAKSLDPWPPDRYFIGYKAKIKRKYLGLKYFPVDNDPSGFIFKWGYTKCWLCRWHWDEKWNWQQGHINFEWEMEHPLCAAGYYRLGVMLYTNTYSNFEIRESNNPIVW